MNLDGVERVSYFKEKKTTKKKNSLKKIFLGLFFIILILVIIFFVIRFFKNNIFSNQNQNNILKIEAPEKINIGQKVILDFYLDNQEGSGLVNTDLFIKFPEKFIYDSSEPECQEVLSGGCNLKFLNIKQGEKKKIQVKGNFFGLPNDKLVIKSEVNFQLENFSSWFKKEASKEIILEKTDLDIQIDNPEELTISENGQFKVSFKNKKEDNLLIRLNLIYSQDFNFKQGQVLETETKEQQKTWDFELKGNQEKTIDFSGFFKEGGPDKKFMIQWGILDKLGEGKNFFLQEEKELPVKITQPAMVLGLMANDVILEEFNQNFGDEIKIKFSYKNIGQEKIFEPNFKIKISPLSIINLDNINDNWIQGEKNIKDNLEQISEGGDQKIISFYSSEINEINANDEGEISFSFKIKSFQDLISLKPSNLIIKINGEIGAKIFRKENINFKIPSNSINIKINSEAKLEAEARYFSDEGLKIGSGSLPPRVNETTSYVIFLRPINFNNEIKNINLSAVLPNKVSWMGEEKISTGKISFDNDNKKINWQIDTLPIYSGGSYSYTEASFKIGLTPGSLDQGKILSLLENIKFEAEDFFTGEKINAAADNFDTNLIFDDLGKDKGTVQ